MEDLRQYTCGLMSLFGAEVLESSKTRVEIRMPITPDLYQPANFLHGGATIALLESAASYAATNNADFTKETVFGVNVNVNHRKSGKSGFLRGIAELDRQEGAKMFWNVVAYDDEGDIISEGSILTLTVSLERLAEKNRLSEERKEAQ